jgi:hypothetical protein
MKKYRNLKKYNIKKINHFINNKIIMNLSNKKIELLKLKFLIENKNNIFDNFQFLKTHKMNIKSYFKGYIKAKKSNSSLIFLNIYNIFKNIKLLFDFLTLSNRNFAIFNIITNIIPGSFSNWKNIKFTKKILLPNICIYLSNIKNLKAENFFYNELSMLKIFQILLQNHFSFYQKLNKEDIFIPINIKNNKEIFILIFNFINKFNKLTKIFLCYLEQLIFFKKIIKVHYIKKNKITHYWTRTNTLKNKNRF